MTVALRVIEERITLVTRLMVDANGQGNTAAAELHQLRLEDYKEQAEILRRALARVIERRQFEA